MLHSGACIRYDAPGVLVGRYSSFILRLWVERQSDGWQWGTVQHVASRKARRFSSIEELLQFIKEHSQESEVSLPFLLESVDPSSDGGVDGTGKPPNQAGRDERSGDGKPKRQRKQVGVSKVEEGKGAE